ncbi:hypothetical protein LOC71_13615 [Rhodopirellula sp. JC740]|uniref:Secreted protein n=1 Tax=Rhodopirellula halodulae TaxID=2894198 RepID=A0ABS8NKI0_9BACT|nr:Lpg1974 family pore-forming outer membrane protein [Rhodopirellula sp. JC740]MCC9643318.1 hypothetical protein [Rhodopirellula sp. JC740]
MLLLLIGCVQSLDAQDEFPESLADLPQFDSPEFQSEAAPVGFSEIEPIEIQPIDVESRFAELQMRINELESQRLAKPHPRTSLPPRSQDGRLFATFESVLVQPTQSNSTAIIVQTDDGFSHVGFPWLIEHSPRIQFGREAAAEKLGWRVRFWEFRHSNSLVANDANGLIPTGNEGTAGYFIENGDILTGLAFINEGKFVSGIRTDVIDWELQRRLAKPMDFYAGVRYAKVAQNYFASTDEGTIHGHSEFRGMGPTMALQINHVLPVEKIQLFANLRGSMLFGSRKFSAIDSLSPLGNLRQTIGDIDLRPGDDSADSLVANAEMQLGLRLVLTDHFNVSVAMEAQHYNGVGGPNPTGVFTGTDGGLNGDSPMDDDLGFLGLTVASQLIW